MGGYKVDGLQHLRILLVDQHIEGDEDTALQWVLRADVERTALLEEEKKLEYWLYQTNNNGVKINTKVQTSNGATKLSKKSKKEKTVNDSEPAAESEPVIAENEPLLTLPDEFVGVDLQLALSEVYDRMQVINVHTAEQRAIHILQGILIVVAVVLIVL